MPDRRLYAAEVCAVLIGRPEQIGLFGMWWWASEVVGRMHSASRFGIRWHNYRLIGAAEIAAAGILAGLWWHPSA
jgi:hypothetical protein